MKTLHEIINSIEPTDANIMSECEKIWDGMGKPIGSLGEMEKIHINMAGMRRTINPDISKRALVVMCADNGIVEEGVTQTGSEVSAIVAENFFDYKTATSIMCKKNNVDMRIIDIGLNIDTKRTINKKLAYGTNNFLKERAISKENVIKAIEVGINEALELAEKGYGIIATGEMGIGNTTTSSAVCAAVLNAKSELVTGRGAGLSDEGFKKKINVIEQAMKIYFSSNETENVSNDGNAIEISMCEKIIDILSAVGGYDICGMVGLFLGSAYAQIPVMIDGFISSVAALCAYKICNTARDYMIATHISAEVATKLIFDEIKLNPPLHANMHLGEGSGAVCFIPFIDMATEIFNKMGTFEDIGVIPYEKFE